MKDEELSNFFNKFNKLELEQFNFLIEDIYLDDRDRIVTMFCKVYSEKSKNNNDVVQSNEKVDLANKLYLLTKKELSFLNRIVQEKSTLVSSVRENSFAYEQVIEDFDESDYHADGIFKLEEAIIKRLTKEG